VERFPQGLKVLLWISIGQVAAHVQSEDLLRLPPFSSLPKLFAKSIVIASVAANTTKTAPVSYAFYSTNSNRI
jgi:hypothetical protein